MTLWGSRVTFEVSSAAPEADPVWVNLTTYALKIEPITVRIGRQNDLDQSEPATLSVLLNNNDDRFTYGNTSSPYTSWWGPGRKCRLRETVGTTVLDIFTGYLQVPTETFVTPSKDQTVSVQAVDRLGRLAASEPFVSTLGAHIVGSARNSALVGYWAMNDAAAPLAATVGTISGTTEIVRSSTRSVEQAAAVEFGGAPAIPGDDVLGLRFIPGLANGSINLEIVNARFDYPVLPLSAHPSILAGQVLTAVLWLNQDVDSSVDVPMVFTITTDSTSAIFELGKSGGLWRLIYFDGTVFSVNGTAHAATERWYCVAIRWGFSPNVLELWVDDQVYTGTFATVVSSAYTLGGAVNLYGGAAHLQLYVGAAADFTFADFTAQRAVGLTGFERQTTGDRIRTIAAYADIPTAEYTSTVDPGTTVMQAAQLAGKTGLDAMREAELTERGLLYANGSGQLVFEDRRSLYNV